MQQSWHQALSTALGSYSPFSEQKPSTSLTCPQSDHYGSIIPSEPQPFVSGSHLSGLRWLPRSGRRTIQSSVQPRRGAAPLGPCPLQPPALHSLSGTQSPGAAHRSRLPRSPPGRQERLPAPRSRSRCSPRPAAAPPRAASDP